MSDTTLTRAGVLTDTVPADLADRQAFERMVEAALYRPNVFTFDMPRPVGAATPCALPEWECELLHTHPAAVVTVSLGYAAYDQGRHHVAYQVEFSATGEIYSGLDFVRDMHTEVRTRVAAVALLAELGRAVGDTALTAFAATLS
jgi:hypothetical protein